MATPKKGVKNSAEEGVVSAPDILATNVSHEEEQVEEEKEETMNTPSLFNLQQPNPNELYIGTATASPQQPAAAAAAAETVGVSSSKSASVVSSNISPSSSAATTKAGLYRTTNAKVPGVVGVSITSHNNISTGGVSITSHNNISTGDASSNQPRPTKEGFRTTATTINSNKNKAIPGAVGVSNNSAGIASSSIINPSTKLPTTAGLNRSKNNNNKKVPPFGCLDQERMKREAGKTSKDEKRSYIAYLDDNDEGMQEFPASDNHNNAVTTVAAACVAGPGAQMPKSFSYGDAYTHRATSMGDDGCNELERQALDGLQDFPATSNNNSEETVTRVGASRVAGPGIQAPQASFSYGGGGNYSQPPTNTMGDEEEAEYRKQLVEAMPVNSVRKLQAQPVDLAQQEEAREAKDKHYKRLACCFITIACLVVALSVGLVFSSNNNDRESSNNDGGESLVPTPNPTRMLPPMENLEILYADLPQQTKDSLSDNGTPQYEAWEWLRIHPNITDLEEWRKKQIFAMVTFYFSFGGSNYWPKYMQRRWLNVSTSECSWVFARDEVLDQLSQYQNELGKDVFEQQDIQPCNEDGQLQTIALRRLSLAGTRGGDNSVGESSITIPPEISLMTSLKIFAVAYSQISAKLSDILVPELTQLPHLLLVNLQESGVSGTIPKTIGQMSTLRHLLLGENRITGSLPVEIANLRSLENFILSAAHPGSSNNKRIPTELGLLTSLTRFEIARSSFTGQIPTELGMLSNINFLNFGGGDYNGPIPSELGLLTSCTHLDLHHNNFSGSVPSQLGFMTSLTELYLLMNALTGPIPKELWQLSHMQNLVLSWNQLTGSISTDLGLMTGMEMLRLGANQLTGLVPRDIGLLTNCTELSLGGNSLTGSIPEELWELSHMEKLWLSYLPNLHGRIPSDIMMPRLTLLRLEESPNLTGIVPDQICSIHDLEFNCSDVLCGCDCPCI